MYLLPSSRGLCLALLSLLPGSTQAVVQLKIRDLGLDDLANLTAMPWETVDVPESSCFNFPECKFPGGLSIPDSKFCRFFGAPNCKIRLTEAVYDTQSPLLEQGGIGKLPEDVLLFDSRLLTTPASVKCFNKGCLFPQLGFC